MYYGNKDIRYEPNFREPQIKYPGEVKIKVDYCGICGSDLHEYLDGPIFFKGEYNEISGFKKKPQVMGHEMCGQIVEVGSDVKDVKVGDKVVVEATGTCLDRHRFPNSPKCNERVCCGCKDGHSNACDYIAFAGLGFTDGGFGEYCVLGEKHVIKYPTDIIPDDVAALTEPLSVAWHAVRRSGLQEGEDALVIGAGPIGLSTIIALKGHKANKIVVSEPSNFRRKQAENLGAEVYSPFDYKDDEYANFIKGKSEDGYGFHYSYDCSGIPVTFQLAHSALRTFGTATNVAIWPHRTVELYPMDLTYQEKIITGSMCYTRRDFEEIIAAYKKGLIDPKEVKTLITKIVPLEDGINNGILELIRSKETSTKILLTPKK